MIPTNDIEDIGLARRLYERGQESSRHCQGDDLPDLDLLAMNQPRDEQHHDGESASSEDQKVSLCESIRSHASRRCCSGNRYPLGKPDNPEEGAGVRQLRHQPLQREGRYLGRGELEQIGQPIGEEVPDSEGRKRAMDCACRGIYRLRLRFSGPVSWHPGRARRSEAG